LSAINLYIDERPLYCSATYIPYALGAGFIFATANLEESPFSNLNGNAYLYFLTATLITNKIVEKIRRK
jgi:hypothetical protein